MKTIEEQLQQNNRHCIGTVPSDNFLIILEIANDDEEGGCCVPLPLALAGILSSLCFPEQPLPDLLGAMVLSPPTEWCLDRYIPLAIGYTF